MSRLTKDRINTVNINRCVVYRLTREELSGNVVALTGGNTGNDNPAILRFNIKGAPTDEWTNFINWWKANENLIILGCNVWNSGSGGNQNKGYYWCPVYRAGNPLRSDSYTQWLEFTITRNDQGIYNNTSDTTYEFYFINLTR